MTSAVFGEADGVSNFGADHRILHARMDTGTSDPLPEHLNAPGQRYDRSNYRNSNLSSAATQPHHVIATGERVTRRLTCTRE